MEVSNEVKARIFGLYLGCDVEYAHTLGDKETIETGQLCGVGYRGELILAIRQPNGLISEGDDNTQLRLKDVADISDEDALEAVNISGVFVHPLLDRKQKSKEVVILWMDNKMDMHFTVADFLRSKGYMLPYLGIDLFKEGIAIKLSTNKD